VREKYPVPFGQRVAYREYRWRSKTGRRRIVKVEFGTPTPVAGSDWGCRLRITGLPTKFDQGIFGIDAVQALELALQEAGSTVASFVKSRAGRIELWDEPVQDALDLHLPLPLHSMQSAVQMLRMYLKRTKAGRAGPAEWRDGVLLQLSNAAADLGALAGRAGYSSRGLRSTPRSRRASTS
jgi:hypothetical protein